MKVKVFEKTEGCFPQQFEIGDWYDLVTAKDIKLFAPVATALKYSTKKNPVTEEEKLKYKRDVVFQYISEKDEWKFPAMATRDVVIPKGTRICQFRIQLNQKANVRQKLKWLFSGSVKLVKVDHLDNEPRGGFGEGTDKKPGLKS